MMVVVVMWPWQWWHGGECKKKGGGVGHTSSLSSFVFLVSLNKYNLVIINGKAGMGGVYWGCRAVFLLPSFSSFYLLINPSPSPACCLCPLHWQSSDVAMWGGVMAMAMMALAQ